MGGQEKKNREKGASVNMNNFLSHEQPLLKNDKARLGGCRDRHGENWREKDGLAELLTVKTILAGQFVIELSVIILTSNLHD